MSFLPLEEWQTRLRDEQARVSPFLEAHLSRRRRTQKHPVWDFLFNYYPFKPALLSRFSPGLGVELEGGEEFLARSEWTKTACGVVLDISRFPLQRLAKAREAVELLQATHERTARHDCFGWHEWAMVYRAPSNRHDLPLRFHSDAIGELLESQTLRCSHYDAVRFWTPDALPLNTLSPRPDDRAAWEQPGCVHANMDLYRYGANLSPWLASSLVIEAFLLAKDARELDMRASPYDLRPFGFEPVPLETPEGRREYAALQREISTRAAPIRARLIETYESVFEALGDQGAEFGV